MPPPILVLTRGDDPNRFAGYLAELLRIEGLNWVELRDLDREPLDGSVHLPHLVLAAAVTFSESEAARLAGHARRGGALLAARPCAALAAAIGLRPPAPLWSSRYVRLEEGHPLAAGLPWVSTGVQYVGQAQVCLPADEAPAPGDTAAWLAPFPGQRSRYPAALARPLGAGRIAVFAFDPAQSAVGQQQGRPEQASTGPEPDFDGDGAFRPNDLFLGQLDPALRDVPQADLQRTLFLRAVDWLTEPAPLPRLWRFPASAPAAALFDGDSDAMSASDFRLALDTCGRYGAPFATYLKPEHLELLEPAEERALRARGHSFGPHPWAGPRPSVSEMRHALEADCAAFAARYGYRPRVHRGHWLVWPGWVDHARSLAGAGIRLDANFSAGRAFQGGYVNGTGLPVRFVDEDGTIMPVVEQSTISTDDGWLSAKTGLPALTLAGAISRSFDQIDASAERYHTVYHPYFHPVSLKGGRALPYPTLPWLEATLAHCRARGVPLLDAERWIDWNDARRQVNLLEDLSEAGGLSFRLRAGAAIEDLTVLVPLPPGAGQVSAAVDGPPVEAAAQPVVRHGRPYASVTVSLRGGETRQIQVRWEQTAGRG